MAWTSYSEDIIERFNDLIDDFEVFLQPRQQFIILIMHFEGNMNTRIKTQKIVLYLSFAMAFTGLMLVRSGHEGYWTVILGGLIASFITSLNLINELQVNSDIKK